MIVRHFVQWVRTASSGHRADATSALARAFLHSDLTSEDRIAAEGAMVMLLDDPSPLVRHALAEALAASPEAPPAVIWALAADRPEIAARILESSPLLLDSDLVDMVGQGDPIAQTAIARRTDVPAPVAAAIAEVGTAAACLTLVENAGAEIAPFSFDRIVERFGHLSVIREAMFPRKDLPPSARQSLVVHLSDAMARFVSVKDADGKERARRLAREACEKATVAMAAASEARDVRPLVTHLRQSGQLTTGLVLRALLSGNVLLFEEALAELAAMPLARVAGIVHDRHAGAFRALYERAGMPEGAYPAFRAAIETLHEIGIPDEPGGATRLRRRMVERVLTRCQEETPEEVAPLIMLLRRFATEAAREEARLYCDRLAAA